MYPDNTQGVSQSMGGQVSLCGWGESRQLISTLALFKGQDRGIFFPGKERNAAWGGSAA